MNKTYYPHQVSAKRHDDIFDDPMATLKCPTCGFNYVHPVGTENVKGHDNYKARDETWDGRGDLLKVKFYGECGSEFELRFGFHKGNTAFWVEVTTPCNRGKTK